MNSRPVHVMVDLRPMRLSTLACVGLLTIAACSSTTTTPDAGGADASAVDSGVATDASVPPDSAGPADSEPPPPGDAARAGACLNAQDAPLSKDSVFFPAQDKCLTSCGLPNSVPASACVTSCLEKTPGLTRACAACWGDYNECTFTACRACLPDTSSQACRDCRDTDSTARACLTTLQKCSGFRF